jgi:hypothetical protein
MIERVVVKKVRGPILVSFPVLVKVLKGFTGFVPAVFADIGYK